MGRDSVFRDPVHLIGPDLNLKRSSRFADQGRVQRLVHIRLRHGDIVLEPPRHRRIHLMDDSQDSVTVLDRLHQHADRK